ncbi:MAG: ribosome small subunit-dependent GTPase A [Acidobacteria bacterium]|nr:MAG: ribosome small subunit-dependent GTPase A [Acidobacteriota bacterium]
MTTLSDLGWDDSWAAAFKATAREGETPARVVLEHNHVYRVFTPGPDGHLIETLAELTGKAKFDAAGRHEMPAVGDWVALRPTTAEGARPQIRAVLPRRSTFSRKAPGRETEEQIVAANIDTVFLVSGLDQDFNPRRIERYLVMARASGAQPVIVLNKADLAEHLADDVALVTALASEVPIHVVTAVGDAPDVSALRAYLGQGQTVALLGSSGVGKSSLINALEGRELLKTAEVREVDGRGRHTSVHRQLVVLERGGLVIDTPGMRELQLWEEDDPLEMAFPEIDALAGVCRFRDCQHDSEPGCAVKAAVADGTIDATRYESYLKLTAERKELVAKQEVRSQLEEKRLSKIGSKALKALQKQRGR